MARADLLALTLDDLATISNRGLVKRAQRELEAGEISGEIAEDGSGEVTVTWTDGVRCTFPAGKTARDGRCTCVAAGICRHLVGAILVYQRGASAESDDEAPAPQSWNPGDIPDEVLKAHFRPQVLKQAAERLASGLLMELVRGPKPTARFHQLACTVRFLVPADVRYTHCECAERPPCGHVPMAVWGFRRLPADRDAGLVSTEDTPPVAPLELMEEAETLLADLAAQGLSSATSIWRDRVVRSEQRLRDAGLVWPAEIAAEMVSLYERYTAHDALFCPTRLAELVGEMLARFDAIRSAPQGVPPLFVRGDPNDRVTAVGKALYTGLGVGVKASRGSVALTAYLQDAESGTVVGVSREFADPPKDSTEPPRAFWDLARSHVLSSVSLGRLGAGQLLILGGKRAPDHRLIPGRARATLNPQGFLWEKLRAPVLVESLQELRARLALLPPASLRPRYVSGNLHVLPVSAVESAGFHPTRQVVQVLVRDGDGEVALVEHPFTSRGAEGVEALLAALANSALTLRFVSGQVRLGSSGLTFAPLALVFDQGSTRIALLPAIDRHEEAAGRTGGLPSDGTGDPVSDFFGELLEGVGELLLLGVARTDADLARTWQDLARQARVLGYHRLARAVERLASSLGQRQLSARWDTGPAVEELLKLTVLARIGQDLSM